MRVFLGSVGDLHKESVRKISALCFKTEGGETRQTGT